MNRFLSLLSLVTTALICSQSGTTAQPKIGQAAMSNPYTYYHVEHGRPGLPNPWPWPYPRPMPPPWWPFYRPWPYPVPVPYPVPDGAGTVVQHPYTPLDANPSTSLLPPPKSTQAVLVIHTPTTQTDLWVDGKKLPYSPSLTRVFTTPELEPGHTYQYTVKAAFVQRGSMVSRTEDVKIRPGQTTTLDLTNN